MNQIKSVIENKLRQEFSPDYLDVVNESHMHSVPSNSETHFKVSLVSEKFDQQAKVRRHQAVYAVLADELAGPVHALALHLYTGEEWKQLSYQAPSSPECHSKKAN